MQVRLTSEINDSLESWTLVPIIMITRAARAQDIILISTPWLA